MFRTRVLRSALLLGLASGIAFSEDAFAQGEVAPVGSSAPVEPAEDPRVAAAQIADAFSRWLERWQKPAMPQRLPQPFPPQTEKELAYIEHLLTYWDEQSGKIERYQAEFSRWVTDPVYGPSETFKTFSKGEIRYESPDKALFRIDAKGQWTPPAQAGGKPTYPDMGDAGREQWIWDGKSLIEFNYSQKKLVERQLPPEMRGKPIAEGRLPFAFGSFLYVSDPFPFVFGAKKEAIQSRYWIRVTTTEEAQERGEFWLEAYPKFGDDAVNYTKIEIIIAGSDFQTSAIKIYERNNVETIYQFTNRSTNWDWDSTEVDPGRSAFDPATPPGWERMVELAPGAAVAPPAAEPDGDLPR